MTRPLRRTLFAVFACLAIIAIPATSTATPQIGQKHNGFSKTDERYLATYVDCWHKFASECGRNIVDDGLSNGQTPTDAKIEASTATMQRWLHPPKPAPVPASSVSETVAAPTPTTTSVATSSASGLPPESIKSCESGGDYSAVNPSSGAYGAWQILGSTAAAYGCDLSTPAGQDQCAAEIYADVGSSAWSCG